MFINIKKDQDVVEVLLEEIKKDYVKKRDDYETKLSEKRLTPMKLKPLPDRYSYAITSKVALGSSPSDMFNNRYPIDNKADLLARFIKIDSIADKYIQDCVAVYEENEAAIENNKKIQEKVTLFMEELGIPSGYTHSYYKTARSSKMTREHRSAGYLGDLQRLMSTQQSPVPEKSRVMEHVHKTYIKLVEEVDGKERKAAEEKKAQEAIHKVALLRAKHTPDDSSSSADDILDALLSKDKYLHLAYWLERNRGDWTDGYAFAEVGLSGFTIETDTDEAIHACIQYYINDWDGDGRVFRDCEWNYNTIYGLVEDKSLMSDLNELTSWNDFT